MSLIYISVGYSMMLLTFSFSMLNPSLVITCPKNLVSSVQNLYFFNLRVTLASRSCCSISLLCSTCSSMVLEKTRMSSRQATTNISKYPSSILNINYQKDASALVSLKGITIYSQCPMNVRKAVFYLSLSLILSRLQALVILYFVKYFILFSLSQISWIKGKGCLSLMVIEFNCRQSTQSRSSPPFFSINRIRYPTDNVDFLIYPFFRLSAIYFFSVCRSFSDNLQIGMNLGSCPSQILILQSNSLCSSSLPSFGSVNISAYSQYLSSICVSSLVAQRVFDLWFTITYFFSSSSVMSGLYSVVVTTLTSIVLWDPPLI